MLDHLSEEILKNIQSYCNKKDWKCLIDTSNESFRDLKYRTIHVTVSFDRLNDRVLPPIVAKLINPSQQLHLYLNTEDSIPGDDLDARLSWPSQRKWRLRDRITRKDIKWFLSIPAQSLDWYGAGPLLEADNLLMRSLRKYEDIRLYVRRLHRFVDCKHLNNCKRIKFLSITNGWGSELPKLPSLNEFTLTNDIGDEINLTNLIYSLSLRKVTIDSCKATVLIPKQLKERGVIIHCLNDEGLSLVEVDDKEISQRNIEQNDSENDFNDNDDNFNVYAEDEVTVYGSEEDVEYDEDADDRNEEDEIDDDEDDDDDDDDDDQSEEG